MVIKEINRGGAFLFLLCAAIISYLIIVPGYFPSLGVSISLGLLSTLVYFFKNQKTKFTAILYIFTLIFSFFIFYRANGFLTFLNTMAVIFLGSLMALSNKNDHKFGFFNFVLSPLNLFFNSLKTTSNYVLDFSLPFKKMRNNQDKLGEIVKSLVLSLVILVIIIPLLASANPFFNNLVNNFLDFFDLTNFFNNLDAIVVLRIIFFLILAILIPRMVTFSNETNDKFLVIGNAISSFNLLLPKILVSITLCIFFITQAQLYFASNETLQTLGYSHSQYAREVFGQLTVVCLIILVVIYNDKNYKKLSKTLTYLLILEGIFLSLIAFKSVFDYSQAWGFTHKRLWGFTGVFWSLAMFSYFSYVYSKKLSDSVFIKGAVIISSITLLAVNIVNFDFLIYHYRKSATGSGIDYAYLARLSPDSEAYNLIIDQIDKGQIKGEGYSAIFKIRRLQEKYKNVDYRIINWSEYKQYQKVKDVDTEHYYRLLESQFLPPPPPIIINEEIKPTIYIQTQPLIPPVVYQDY
ncbi:DUF4173 domain-containing protein [Candidatus Gottesmanbacteria bacterium]|nr:DUF4173 domain-containing protein [Candidatus Gottesmanbacteria bacterium]